MPSRRRAVKSQTSPAEGSDLAIVRQVNEARVEADDARRDRMEQNKINFDAYNERQDWSEKIEGQSTEFLPKTHLAVETFTAFIKKGLVDSQNWYMPEFGMDSPFPLPPEIARRFLDAFLGKVMISESETVPIQQQLVDGLKLGAIGAIAIFKIHGQIMAQRRYTTQPVKEPADEALDSPVPEEYEEPEADEMAVEEAAPESFEEGEPTGPPMRQTGHSSFYLRFDVIRQEDFFIDPTGRGLYKIHRVTRDYYEVLARAKEGAYDLQAVEALGSWVKQEDAARAAREKNQRYARAPSRRWEVTIDEYWGTLLNEDGTVYMRNCVCAVANEQFLIRKPKPNPNWHQEDPFIVVPIIRVPLSQWHRALIDGPVKLNLALNELFNLMLDGGLASVWGVKEVRVDALEHPEEISGGIPQGAVIPVKAVLPHGQTAINVVKQGELTQHAMAMYEALSREFTQAAMSNELKLGQFPGHSVKAAEVVEMAQSQGALIESIVKDIEYGVGSGLRKAWMVLMQHADKLDAQTVVNAIGMRGALLFSRMSESDRYAMFANPCAFKVKALSTLVQRIKDFQKLMALMQAIGQNPILMMEFFRTFSPRKVLSHMMRTLSIDPIDMHRDEKEMGQLAIDFDMLRQMTQMIGQPGGGQSSPDSAGGGQGASMQGEVQQTGNPLTGMGGSQ